MPPKRSKSRAKADAQSDGSSVTSNSSMPILTPQVLPTQSHDNSNKNNLPNFKIQTFDGNPDELNFFINQIKDIARIQNWSDDVTLVQITSHLRGKALQLISQKREFSPFESSDHLFEELKAHFTQTSVASYIVEYENLQMLPHETISNLSHRLEFLTHKVYNKVTDPQALDQIKYVKLLKVIPPNYRLLIMQNNITNYKIALEKARLAQDCEIQNSVLSNTPAVAEKDRFLELTEQVNNLQTTINKFSEGTKINEPTYEKSANKPRPNFQFQNKRIQHNNFTGRRGNFRRDHFKHSRGNRRNFRHPHRNNYRNQNSRNFQATQPENLKCQLCLCVGHSARECSIAPAMHSQSLNYNTAPAITHPNF